jgi:hypothetical protein
MTNYKAYRSAVGISSGQMIETIRAEYPKFSKIQNSMVSNPAYGICLLPEAESLLVEKYGTAPGLTVSDGHTVSKATPRKADKRRKKNRMTVRLDDETALRVRELMTAMHYIRAQDFLEQALLSMLENWEASHA